MNTDDSANDWSSGEESESQICDAISNNRAARGCPPSQLRPARKTLPFVPFADWVPGQSYEEQPPFCMHYIMEWKLTVNKRVTAKQTEDDLVVAPSDFWKNKLSSQVADIVNSRGNPCIAEVTTIVLSVNDRSEQDITKYFKELEIDWAVVEKQLQSWSHLLRIGKTLRIKVSFNYMDNGKTGRTAGRGATATQLAERNARVDAEQTVSGTPDAWRQVYGLLKCPGPPCDRGPYCWQDPDTKKHYKLMGHHLRSLVKFVQRGSKLEAQSDVPEDIRKQLYAEEQQQSNRKRKRLDSGLYSTDHPPMVINNYIPTHLSQAVTGFSGSSMDLTVRSSLRSSSLSIPGMRDDAVDAYCRFHCSRVKSQAQKQNYELARDLTLERGFDLDLIYEDNDAQYYIDQGIIEGVARRWVKDVSDFLDGYKSL